jgi:hypothetical protein
LACTSVVKGNSEFESRLHNKLDKELNP